MIRFITLAISCLLLPLAMIMVAWDIAKTFIEDKVDE